MLPSFPASFGQLLHALQRPGHPGPALSHHLHHRQKCSAGPPCGPSQALTACLACLLKSAGYQQAYVPAPWLEVHSRARQWTERLGCV